MQSRNKPAQSLRERAYVTRIKALPCGVCGTGGGDSAPSEAHEIEQGLWFLTIPLCSDCHRGAHNGLHGRRHAWKVRKLTELAVLNATIGELHDG